MRITVSCPASLVDDANHLAMCLAFGPADGMTYAGLRWMDDAGNLYAAASFEARDEWLSAAQAKLTRPAWDADQIIDMAAAEKAQASLLFSLEQADARPDRLTAIGGMDGPQAIRAMGLVPVPEEELL